MKKLKEVILTSCFVVFFWSTAIAVTVPLPLFPEFGLKSHAAWRQYQLAPRYTDWPGQSNMNCGPASVASILKLYYNIDLSTAINSAPPKATDYNSEIKTEARWEYHVGNDVVGGFDGGYDSGELSGTVSRVLKYNGLKNEVLTGDNVTLSAIRAAIDQDGVVICHVDPSEYQSTTTTSHWVVAFGYDCDYIYINDPGYSDIANHPVSNQTFTDALSSAGESYAGPGGDKVLITVEKPVIGWMENRFDYNKKFIEAYLECGGVDMLGMPWNGPGGEWVHEWPDAGGIVPFPNTCNAYGLYVQDFLEEDGHWWQLVYNLEKDRVYPVHGQILTYWHNNLGYLLGAPQSYEYNKRNEVGDLLVVQEFKKSGTNNTVHYLGFNTVTGFSREYALFELFAMTCEAGDDSDYIIDPDQDGPGGGGDATDDNPEEDYDVPYEYDNTSIGIGIEAGDEAWSKRIISEQTEFSEDDQVSVILKLLNLKADFALHYLLYRDGTKVMDFSTDTLVVDSEYGWAYSYLPIFENTGFSAGDYSLRIYIFTEGEEKYLDTVDFQVQSKLDYLYQAAESTICEDVGNGTEPWSMVAINPKSVFTDQEQATFFIGIKDVFVNHRFKVEFFRNGEYSWEYAEENWRIVDPSYGWSYSYFNPSQAAGALAGEYTAYVYLDTGNGFFLLDTGEFSVIRTAPDYVFVGAQMCKDYQEGTVEWSWEPKEPTNVFKKDLEAAKCLVILENVYVDVRFKNDVYYKEDGIWKLFWSSGATAWYGIKDKWGFVYYMPSQSAQVPARDYQFRISMDSGEGFQPLTIMEFSVVE